MSLLESIGLKETERRKEIKVKNKDRWMVLLFFIVKFIFKKKNLCNPHQLINLTFQSNNYFCPTITSPSNRWMDGQRSLNLTPLSHYNQYKLLTDRTTKVNVD